MWWHPLGHAMALAEVDGLRLLFDPLLDDVHHGGVFEVFPPRVVHEEALAPDFIFVTHRHPDHFDIRSLRRLAMRDPDAVVITPDALVGRVATRLGFRTVRHVTPSARIELDTVRLLTTPSRANAAPIAPEALEFGVAIADSGAIVWNQVDTLHGSVAELLETKTTIESELSGRLALALIQWCPLLEVEASLAGAIGFPFAAYGRLLAQARALDTTVVPASAGARHAGPFTAMNALVYPVDEARFLRDLRDDRALPSGVGGAFEITAAGVRFVAGSELVSVRSAVDDRDFKPLAIPALFDPGADDAHARETVDRWVHEVLAPALGRRCYLLEVVYRSTRDVYTIRGSVRRQHDAEWDIRNEVAGSMLCDVIEGRRHWGDLLLAGTLRACSRAYDVHEAGLTRGNDPPIFLYAALSYTSSVERAVEHELGQSAASTAAT